MRDLWGNVIEIKNPLETGKIFEKHIANILKEYDGCNIAEQVNIGNKFGNHKHIVDILVNRKIIISVKLQNVGGTAEEKVGYEMYVLNKSQKINTEFISKIFKFKICLSNSFK